MLNALPVERCEGAARGPDLRRRATLRGGLARAALASLALLALLTLTTRSEALSGAEAVARAQQWVNAGMPYCQVPYGGCDSHVCCGAGYRPENPQWDPYRSDCSGLVSWAWNLGGPGRVTWGFAPFDTSVTHVIDGSQLQPGDALNSGEHVMLFVAWAVPGQVADLIDEYDWGHAAEHRTFNVWVNGSTVTRSDWPSNPFQAVRYDGLQSCSAGCQGTSIVHDDCSTSDCGAFAATCANDQLGLRCVSDFCPALGDAKVCLPDGHTLGDCHDGSLGATDCAAQGGICVKAGGAHCMPLYDAAFVGQGSDAAPDPTKKADYRVCAGQDVSFWFELRDTGVLPWSDSSDPAAGKSVRLGTTDPPNHNFADPLTGGSRVSVSGDANGDVRWDGPSCDDQPGCNATVFRLSGTAPSLPGVYKTSWQLVDEQRAWFGPVVWLTFDVACGVGDPSSHGSTLGGPQSGSHMLGDPPTPLPGVTAPGADPTAASPSPSSCTATGQGPASSPAGGALLMLAAIGAALRRSSRRP